MTNENTEFTPMIIGEPDKQQQIQVTDLYNEICIEASSLEAYLQMMFAENEQLINIDFLSELLDSSNPETLLRSKWINHKNINIPGVDMVKFMNSDLLEIPKYEEILAGINYLKELLVKAQSLKFKFSLQKLVDAEGYFTLTEEFHNQLHESGIVYTENEQQNQVLQAITELKDAINKVCNLGLLPVNNLANISFRFDRHVLKRTNQKFNPFELNPRMFYTTLRHIPKV